MIFSLFTNWRFFLFVGILALVVVGSFLPQTGHLLTASWWFDHQSKQTANWQIVRRTVPAPQWWIHVRQGYRWARAGLGLGICLSLLWHLLTQPVPAWAWLCLLSVSYATGQEIRCVLSDWIKIEPVSSPVTEVTESEIEVIIDLEPILENLSDLPLAGENSTTRSLRTVWGATSVHVPKLRCGNKKRDWQVIERYERSFGPWLDLQLHMYRLGLSQGDLQETLHLGFGQVLSTKSIQHLTDVAGKDMEAFRQALLEDTPRSSSWMASTSR